MATPPLVTFDASAMAAKLAVDPVLYQRVVVRIANILASSRERAKADGISPTQLSGWMVEVAEGKTPKAVEAMRSMAKYVCEKPYKGAPEVLDVVSVGVASSVSALLEVCEKIRPEGAPKRSLELPGVDPARVLRDAISRSLMAASLGTSRSGSHLHALIAAQLQASMRDSVPWSELAAPLRRAAAVLPEGRAEGLRSDGRAVSPVESARAAAEIHRVRAVETEFQWPSPSGGHGTVSQQSEGFSKYRVSPTAPSVVVQGLEGFRHGSDSTGENRRIPSEPSGTPFRRPELSPFGREEETRRTPSLRKDDGSAIRLAPPSPPARQHVARDGSLPAPDSESVVLDPHVPPDGERPVRARVARETASEGFRLGGSPLYRGTASEESPAGAARRRGGSPFFRGVALVGSPSGSPSDALSGRKAADASLMEMFSASPAPPREGTCVVTGDAEPQEGAGCTPPDSPVEC